MNNRKCIPWKSSNLVTLSLFVILFCLNCTCVFANVGIVSGLSQTEGKSNSISIAWNKVQDASNYQWAIDLNGDGNYYEGDLTAKTNATLSNLSLKAGTTYHVKVRAVNGKKGAYEYGSYCLPIEVVTAPTGTMVITQTSASTTSFSFVIGGLTGANYYSIVYYPTNEASNKISISSTTDTVELSNLIVDKQYTIEITAYRKSDSSGVLAPKSGVKKSFKNTVFLLPSQISGLKKDEAKKCKVTFSWNKNPIAQYYELGVFDSPSAETPIKSVQVIAKDFKNKTIELDKCGMYYAKVRGYLGFEGQHFNGPWTDAIAFSTQNQDHKFIKTSVSKQPTCTEKGEEIFTCEYCNTQETRAIDPLGHNYGDWKYVDKNVHERVCANDPSHVETASHRWSNGEITESPTISSTGIKTYTCKDCGATKKEKIDKLVPTKPANVSALKAYGGKGSIKLTWKKANKAQGYIIYRSTNSKSGFKKIKTINKASTLKYTDTNLKSGKTYYYRIKAYRIIDGTWVSSNKFSKVLSAKVS